MSTNPTQSSNNALEERQLFSLSKVKDISHGDESFVAEMVSIFIEQAAWAIEQFEQGLAENNRTQLKQTAHRIKPSIRTMQISSIEEEVLFVEVNAESIENTQSLKDQVLKITTVLQQVTQQLTNITNQK